MTQNLRTTPSQWRPFVLQYLALNVFGRFKHYLFNKKERITDAKYNGLPAGICQPAAVITWSDLNTARTDTLHLRMQMIPHQHTIWTLHTQVIHSSAHGVIHTQKCLSDRDCQNLPFRTTTKTTTCKNKEDDAEDEDEDEDEENCDDDDFGCRCSHFNIRSFSYWLRDFTSRTDK